MATEATCRRSTFPRALPVKWFASVIAGVVVIMAIIVVTAVLVDRQRDSDRLAAASAATSTPAVTTPYDFTELPLDADLDVVEDAAFVSILLAADTGSPTSYGISDELPAAQALIEAVKDADELSHEEAAAALGAAAAESTLTFVLSTRETLTLALYLDRGMIARGGQAWRAEGDLQRLVEEAIAPPG